MPLTPDQHRRPKKEDLPPWPKDFNRQMLWYWTVYRRDIATAAASMTSIITGEVAEPMSSERDTRDAAAA